MKVNMIDVLSKILPGNKTVIAAAGLVLAAYWCYLAKDYTQALVLLSQALAAVGIRVAVTPTTPEAPVSPPSFPVSPTPAP